MARIDEFLTEVMQRRGSDLHFIAGDPPRIRLWGDLSPLRAEPLTIDFAREALLEIMPAKARERFERHDGADFAYSLGEIGRFRVNVMRQLNGMGAVFRSIPSKALTMDELKLPQAVASLARAHNGLILVTGKTGSGKSTTLAAMIDDINRRDKGHILTIEDPIEFVHQRRNCLISQREIGVHAQSFAQALHSALREDPDVILVGEMRDLETISIAVTAAEMGILVMGTLHTNGAAPTVDRIINVFPADKQSHVRTMLSTSLRGVISQQLLQRADKPGRVAALEVLVNNSAVANLIRQGKLDQLENTMQSGGASGMRTMDSSIQALLDQRLVTGKEAYKKGIAKSRFEAVKDQGVSGRRLLVTCALPYANGALHLGHMLEAVQADIWCRFQRARGHDCLYVCAEDCHGAPIMIRARQEGITPEALITAAAASHQRDYAGFGVGFDHFHSTHSDENRHYSGEIYRALQARGVIDRRTIRQAYDEQAGMFLPDRFVRGTCPRCGTADQYGDSCESCGATYSPTDLKDAVSTITGTKPVLRDSEHLFFRLGEFASFLQGWLADHQLQAAVRAKLAEWFEAGLSDWDISRDAPYFGFEIPDAPGKYFYVWFDAPIGYIGSFAALARRRGLDFDAYWKAGAETELHHFIGKDISYFHTLFWPAMLHGAGYRTPTGVHVHGFLTVDGQKMSKTRGSFITAARYLELLPADHLRYYYAAKLGNGLEDIDFSLADFTARVNSDLIGKLVNIASRCAPFIDKSGGRLADALPDPALYGEFVAAAPRIGALFEGRDFGAAVRDIMQVADRANQYVDAHKPWLLARDPARLGEARAVATQGINLFRVLMVWLAPVLPRIAATAEGWLGEGTLASWDGVREPLLGRALGRYPQLATRVDPAIVQQLVVQDAPAFAIPPAKTPVPSSTTVPAAQNAAASARKTTMESKPTIGIEDFAKLDLRAAQVLEASRVEGSDKLLQLKLDLGTEQRNVFSGIAAFYKPEDLVGRFVVMIANLAPRKMRFGVSEGMVLCASDKDSDAGGVFVLSADAGVRPGMKVS